MREKDEKLAVNIVGGLLIMLMLIMSLVSLVSCSTVKYVPVGTETVVEYRDTTIYLTDTVTIEIPKEVVKEIVPQDKISILSTSLATSEAKIEKGMLTHRLEQKGTLKTQIDTIVTVQYVDRYINKEVPIEVVKEVKHIPNWCWYSLIFNIVIILFIAFRIYLKSKGV